MRKTKKYALLIKIAVLFLTTLNCTKCLNAHERCHCTDENIIKKFKNLKETKEENDAAIRAADETNDLIERIRVRKNVIEIYKQIRNDAKASQHYDTEEECKKYQNHIEKDLPDIERDLRKKLDQIEKDMASNDEAIKKADETHNLYERKRVYQNIRDKSYHAANFFERYAQLLENWKRQGYSYKKSDAEKYRKLATEYRNYQYKVEEDMGAIEADINKKFEEFDAEIKAADETHDLNERKHVRILIIEKCTKEEIHAKENHREDIAKKYHDFGNEMKGQLIAIEADIVKEIKKREQEERDREAERKRKKEKDEAKPSFEQEGKSYESHLMMDQNKEKVAKADESCSIEGQIKVRKEVFTQTEEAIKVAEEFIKVVNEWNNKWGDCERIEGDHPWSAENIRKKIEEYNNYKTLIEEESLTLEKLVDEERQRQEENQQQEKERKRKEEEERQKKAEGEEGYSEADKPTKNENIEFEGSGGELHSASKHNEIMNLKSINVDLVTGNVAFILQSESYNVLIKSNLNFIKHYIEEKDLHGGWGSYELPNIEDNLPIFGLEEETEETTKLIIFYITNVLPIFRTKESITQLISRQEEGWEIDEIKLKTQQKRWINSDKSTEIPTPEVRLVL